MVVLTLCFNGEWNPRGHALRSPLLMFIIAGALAVGETAEVSEQKIECMRGPSQTCLFR